MIMFTDMLFRYVQQTRCNLVWLTTILLFFCVHSGISQEFTDTEEVGILVMAHGGKAEWNAAVEKAVAPLRTHCLVEVAFGMAKRNSLQHAITQLEAAGVTRIAVVRLFISGESFRHQTEYLFGLRSDPQTLSGYHHSASDGVSQDQLASTHVGHDRTPTPLQKRAIVVLSEQGLSDSPGMGEILADRVQAQSKSPEKESVLILAHGAGSDDENRRWIARMNEFANKVRKIGDFRAVRVETLREDWPEKRKAAEQRIHEFVEQGNLNDGRVIVVPFRVFGFGPYREVLADLQYEADGLGLLPHPQITEWLKHQAVDCFSRAGWDNPF